MAEPTSLWDRWLAAACLAAGGFGAVMVLFHGCTADAFDALVSGSDDPPFDGDRARAYAGFVYGVLGAVMVGWMALTFAVATGPLRRRERWAWRAVACSLSGWFAVDTLMSLVSGYPENALLNVAFALAFAPPLAALRRTARGAPATGWEPQSPRVDPDIAARPT